MRDIKNWGWRRGGGGGHGLLKLPLVSSLIAKHNMSKKDSGMVILILLGTWLFC